MADNCRNSGFPKVRVRVKTSCRRPICTASARKGPSRGVACSTMLSAVWEEADRTAPLFMNPRSRSVHSTVRSLFRTPPVNRRSGLQVPVPNRSSRNSAHRLAIRDCYHERDTNLMGLNYTVADMLGCLIAVPLFVLAGITCGYVSGWFTGILGFRTLSVPWRLLIAVPLSVGLYPILIYWTGVLLGRAGPLVLFGFFATAFVLLFAVSPGHEKLGPWLGELRGIPRVVWLIAAVWIAVVVGSLIDLQIGSRLYYSVTAEDLCARTTVTNAITRTGVPPDNPYYFIQSSAPLRYHYFWFLLSSLVNRLGGAAVHARIEIGSAH